MLQAGPRPRPARSLCKGLAVPGCGSPLGRPCQRSQPCPVIGRKRTRRAPVLQGITQTPRHVGPDLHDASRWGPQAQVGGPQSGRENRLA